MKRDMMIILLVSSYHIKFNFVPGRLPLLGLDASDEVTSFSLFSCFAVCSSEMCPEVVQREG
jgi:hypothetical protein